MAKIEIELVPNKELTDNTYVDMVKKIAEEENGKIAFRFRIEQKDIKVNLYFSKSLMLFKIKETSEKLGVFGGFSEEDRSINLIYPEQILSIYRDNLELEIRKIIRYSLIKFYAYEKYVKDDEDKKVKLREIIEGLARITSENYRVDALKFELKTLNKSKKFNKELKSLLFFYSILVLSGIKFIYLNLDRIMMYGDIDIAAQKIYKKTTFELFMLTKMKLEKIERKTINTFKVRNK